MALSRAKYRRVTELYTPGIELELLDDAVIWLKAINPFERDEAQRDAQLARSRLVMALKGPHADEERQRVQGAFLANGHTEAITQLSVQLANEKLADILNEIKDDPDWKERVEVIERSESLKSAPVEEVESKHLEDITAEYLNEIQTRIETERDYHLQRLAPLSEEDLLAEYIDVYITTRGGTVATAEYTLTEAWYAARVCEGVKGEDGTWDHSACEGHKVQVFETKQELREAPEVLQNMIGEKLREMAISVREARFLPKPASSSESSPPPSAEAASTASTPDATSGSAPGT